MEEMEKIPLEERLARLNGGVVSPIHGAAVVRRWARTPLGAYLEGQAKAKEAMIKILGKGALDMPYQEAALQIRRLLRSPDTRNRGLDLLWYLSFPLQVAAIKKGGSRT